MNTPVRPENARPAFGAVRGGLDHPRETQIIATLGPSQSYNEGDGVSEELYGFPSKDKIRALVDAGTNVFRLNFSHLKREGEFKTDKYENHRECARLIREIQDDIEAETGERPDIKIMADLQGPKCRLGVFERDAKGKDKVPLEKDDIIRFDTDPAPGTKKGKNIRVQLQYQEVVEKLDVGNKVILADNKVAVEITEKGEDDTGPYVVGRVTRGQELSSNKGFNVPDLDWHPDPLQPKDREDAHIAVEVGADMIALSFLQTGQHMRDFKDYIASIAPPEFTFESVAKIEKPGALVNIEDIARESDHLMFARGDLGSEIKQKLLPLAKHLVVNAARNHGATVIIATQVMSSMEHADLESRPETCDLHTYVAVDGAGFIMTSEETAMGDNPPQVVARIIANTEQAEAYRRNAAECMRGFQGYLAEMYNGKSGAAPIPGASSDPGGDALQPTN